MKPAQILPLNRRAFLGTAAGAVTAIAAPRPGKRPAAAVALGQPVLTDKVRQEQGDGPLAGSTWYVGESEGEVMTWKFAPGTLAKARYITTDMLLDGNHLAVFLISLCESGTDRIFRFVFGGLNQASFRVRFALDLVDQHRWMNDREGAFLKPMAGGDRVDLEKVDRMTMAIWHKAPEPVRWAMTPLSAAPGEVTKITAPLLPKGKLLDEFGQSTLHDWPAKTRSVEELKARLNSQYESAPQQAFPEVFTPWGGWKANKLGEGSGFFRTRHDGRRWWLVDPDGYAFWSAGADCVRVDCLARYDGLETALKFLPDRNGEYKDIYHTNESLPFPGKLVNYLAANFIRTFGPSEWRDRWARIVLAELTRLRFNTVGNWSEWQYAAKAKFPYVRPMSFRGKRSGFVYRDFPDVFHPEFEADAAEFASQLASTAQDPAFIGYFLMNEPTWGFSSELPAVGMLYNTPVCKTREELVRFLKQKYADDAVLSSAWKMQATFEHVAQGKWTGIFTKEAQADLQEFSVTMVEKYFIGLSGACKKVDPNHLNLGMRWAGLPPAWAVRGMKSFDVFSLNCYREKLPLEQAKKIHEMLNMPVMVGEWHFGALDAGLPASGIGHVKTQEDRGRAYRTYLEDAAADPYCVGVHWFTLYDESALGRFDGENYNIGFLDTCNRPYEEIGRAAIASHERMYDVAAGSAQPYAEAPEYLPLVYL